MRDFITYATFMIILGIILFFAFTFIHEAGHQQALSSEGIESRINLNLVWPHGETSPATFDNCEKFNGLQQEAKAKIYYAGIRYNTSLLTLISFFLLASLAFSLKKPEMLSKTWYCLLLLGLIEAILILIYPITINANPTTSAGDMWKLVHNFTFDCNSLFLH
mgnify:CR=1 FL=1